APDGQPRRGSRNAAGRAGGCASLRALRGHIVSAPPRVTIVLPCFNEGGRIAASLATLHLWFGDEVEILVIDDASGDDTVAQAGQAVGAGPCRVHRLPRHRGKGGAIRSAVPLVRTGRLVIMDADVVFDR